MFPNASNVQRRFIAAEVAPVTQEFIRVQFLSLIAIRIRNLLLRL